MKDSHITDRQLALLLHPCIEQSPHVVLSELEVYPTVRIAGLDETLVFGDLRQDGVTVGCPHCSV